MDAGLAERQGISEQLTATGRRPWLGSCNLPPEAIASQDGIVNGRLPKRWADVGRYRGTRPAGKDRGDKD
jgi:hypothetical protein